MDWKIIMFEVVIKFFCVNDEYVIKFKIQDEINYESCKLKICVEVKVIEFKIEAQKLKWNANV